MGGAEGPSTFGPGSSHDGRQRPEENPGSQDRRRTAIERQGRRATQATDTVRPAEAVETSNQRDHARKKGGRDVETRIHGEEHSRAWQFGQARIFAAEDRPKVGQDTPFTGRGVSSIQRRSTTLSTT